MRFIDRLTNPIRALYWAANRPFLRAFSEALIGEKIYESTVSGEEIVISIQQYLRRVPVNVYQQVSLALAILPVYVPRWAPEAAPLRMIVMIAGVLISQWARVSFVLASPKQRTNKLNQIYTRLRSQAKNQVSDSVRTIVALRVIKSLISACFLDMPKTWKLIGYSPYPSKLPWDPPSGNGLSHIARSPVYDLLHANSYRVSDVCRKPRYRTTYCVIGSGAGGAIAARSILERDAKARVIIIETGPILSNDTFSIYGLQAIADAYMNGGATLSKNQQVIFRQGRGVGGSTIVNNGVAIKPDGYWWNSNIVTRWKSLNVNLDWDKLYACYDEVSQLLSVHPIDNAIITPMAEIIKNGFQKSTPNLQVSLVPVNVKNCIGCGRCNYGCQYDSKQSMINAVLPEAIAKGAMLVPNTHVESLTWDQTSGVRRVRSVAVKDNYGSWEVEADKVVMAAGAYASTKILMKSDYAGFNRHMPTVGKQFSGNFGTPVIGVFDKSLRGWAGQQVGYVVSVPDLNMVIETAFAPPAAAGLLIGQFGREFSEIVENYDSLASAVPVFSSSSYGCIKRGLLPSPTWFIDYRTGGFVIDYQMTQPDWDRLGKGIRLTSDAMFAMGAKEVLLATFDGMRVKSSDKRINEGAALGPESFLHIETAHLQGGNVMSSDPTSGVVNNELRVHGFSNLWICDASVIPAPITLNIQLTVMALSRYAADHIVG